MPSKSEPFSFAEILKSIDVGQNLTSELAQRVSCQFFKAMLMTKT